MSRRRYIGKGGRWQGYNYGGELGCVMNTWGASVVLAVSRREGQALKMEWVVIAKAAFGPFYLELAVDWRARARRFRKCST